MAGSFSGAIFKRNGRDLDMRIIRGASLSFSVSVSKGGQPQDLTGWSASLTAQGLDGSQVLSLTTSNGKAQIAGGSISFNESPAVTAQAQNGTWNISVTDASGVVRQLVSGRVTAIGDVWK